MLSKSFRILSVISLVSFSLIANDEEKTWGHHPLWVGYQSTLNGRDPSLAGKIEKELIAKYLPEDPIIVEAGAYDGTDSLKMAEMWPKALIYSFEPMPFAYKLLKEKVSSHPRIKIYQAALCDKTGVQPFFLSSGAETGSSSLLPPDQAMKDYHGNIQFSETIDVPTITLDDWAKQNNITHIDFLWLDLQGVEPDVLRASPKIFKTVKVVCTEVSLVSLYKGSVLYPDFKKWMQEQGFKVVVEDMPWLDGGNALFVRK